MSSHSFFFSLPSLSYFFIYYFSLNTRTHASQFTSHKSPFFFFFFFFLFSLLNFPHHIFTHPLPTTRFTPTPSLFLFPSIFLYSTVHIFIGFVHFFLLLLFPTHVHEPKFAAEFLFFFLRCHWDLLSIFAEFVEKWKS